METKWTKWYAMTSHVIAYRSLELLFGTHTFHFNCFFDDFNCVFTQIHCLSRVLWKCVFSFWHPKQMLELVKLENIHNFTQRFCLSGPMKWIKKVNHICLAFLFLDIGKHSKPSPDATELLIWVSTVCYQIFVLKFE